MLYHFGTPGVVIWASHILFALYFAYLAKELISAPTGLGLQIHGTVLVALGAIMATYHGHLWIMNQSN